MTKHVSCKGCGLIWHDEDLDEDGLCPDCQAEPEPETVAGEGEDT